MKTLTIPLRTPLRRVLAVLLLAAGLPAAAQTAGPIAQNFPSRPVTIIVPNAPSGLLDVLARILQPPLQALWKQTVVVEYKPGATTAVGTEATARAKPDGYTICVVTTPHVLNPAMQKLSYDTVKDLSGITLIGVSNAIITATPSFPANTLGDAIDLIRKNPGKYSYASPGAGSSMHLAMELLKQRAGIDLLHVPFKGSGPAYPEVFSGRVEFLIDPLFPTLSHVKAGKLKALAVTGAKRSAVAPDVPVVADAFPGFAVNSLFGVVVASGTPRDVVNKLYTDISGVLQTPEIAKKLADIGLDPQPVTPEQFDTLIRTEIERWIKFVKAARISND